MNIPIKAKAGAVAVVIGLIITVAAISNQSTVAEAKKQAAECHRLITHVGSQNELILLLLARPECGAQLTKPLRDSLGLEVAIQ